ncbi:hypothetical protein KQJ29_31510, partial [Enterococcus sp. S181_ASV_20]|nr:hypothetical protein [Enterococcus sp. S181_ASV_20]
MNKVIYQLTTEDVSHFLTNKEHLNEVIRRIQKDFSIQEKRLLKVIIFVQYFSFFIPISDIIIYTCLLYTSDAADEV